MEMCYFYKMEKNIAQLVIRECIGKELLTFIDALAHLRIEIFHDYPYLYEGSLDYEHRYLKTYSSCEQAYCGLVFDGEILVGATTGIPMKYETQEVKAPFSNSGIPESEVFYFGESILKKTYRGQGLGIQFFKLRETYAQQLSGVRYSAFCGVVRPENHPLKPEGYKPLDDFWQRMGYIKQVGMLTEFSWKDIGEESESKKPMQFWMKTL